jgi:hypothetical protein
LNIVLLHFLLLLLHLLLHLLISLLLVCTSIHPQDKSYRHVNTTADDAVTLA